MDNSRGRMMELKTESKEGEKQEHVGPIDRFLSCEITEESAGDRFANSTEDFMNAGVNENEENWKSSHANEIMDAPSHAVKRPLTSAAKMRRLRAKRKNDPEFSSKESQRVEALRQKRVKEMTASQRNAYRKAAAMRKQKSRASKLKVNVAEVAQKAYKMSWKLK